MTMPGWWDERRFGIFVDMNVASVPGWSPIGEDASWYRSHLGEDVADVVLHARPLVEVLAHHRDRWGHVETYDEFVPLLTFEQFDAEALAQLVADAGANYAVFTAKHHDGWAWWDAPGTTRRLTDVGPRRDVLAESAAACERHGVVFATALSLLDWSDERSTDPSRSREFADQVLHPQALDLVGRYGSAYLRADGGWAHDGGHWRSAELLTAARQINPDLVVNDGLRASLGDGLLPISTYEFEPPEAIVTSPWELLRSIGPGRGFNRAAGQDHHLDASSIVALYTEVLAKGGSLLLSIAPDADGTVPDLQTDPLRGAGAWIRRYGSALASTRPWTTWGDGQAHYLQSEQGIVAIDVSGAGRFAALSRHTVAVREVLDLGTGLPVRWHQNERELRVELDGSDDAPLLGIAAFEVVCVPAEAPGLLFEPADDAPIALAPLLADARPGDIVQLGDGVYEGAIEVPPGVTLRGLGADRTHVGLAMATTPTIVPDPPVIRLGPASRIEHLRVINRQSRPERFARPLVEVTGSGATVLGCSIDGSIRVAASDVLLRALNGQGVIADDVDRLHVSRCRFTGNAWDVGVELHGGDGHLIDSTELSNHLCAIRLTETTGTTVRGNTIRGRWWGVHVDHAEAAHVHGNRINATMRAVDVDGGSRAIVDGNAVVNGDSGCIVEDGAADCEVYGNHWDRCRIGLLAWDAVGLHHQDNVTSSPNEPDSALVTGP